MDFKALLGDSGPINYTGLTPEMIATLAGQGQNALNNQLDTIMKLQTMKQQQGQFDVEMGQRKDEFGMTMAQRQAEMAENARQFDAKFGQDDRQFLARMGLDRDIFTQDVKKSAALLQQGYAKMSQDERLANRDFFLKAQDLVESRDRFAVTERRLEKARQDSARYNDKMSKLYGDQFDDSKRQVTFTYNGQVYTAEKGMIPEHMRAAAAEQEQQFKEQMYLDQERNKVDIKLPDGRTVRGSVDEMLTSIGLDIKSDTARLAADKIEMELVKLRNDTGTFMLKQKEDARQEKELGLKQEDALREDLRTLMGSGSDYPIEEKIALATNYNQKSSRALVYRPTTLGVIMDKYETFTVPNKIILKNAQGSIEKPMSAEILRKWANEQFNGDVEEAIRELLRARDGKEVSW